MIKIYLKFLINSSGESPRQLMERLRGIGGLPLVGEYDAEIPLGETERLFHKLQAIHRALKGSGVFYSVYTGLQGVAVERADAEMGDTKTLELRKKFYRTKLARWKEMGLDTAELETLLEEDLDRFKEVSKTYLREHLDKSKVVEDVGSDLQKIDDDVLGAVDDLGVSLDSVCKLCGLQERDAVLSLGRLISAGKVRHVVKGGREVYVLAPPRRKTRSSKEPLLPAKSEAEAVQRVLAVIRAKGGTLRQICRDSRLPEGQVMNAIADLLKGGRLRSAKRGNSTIYLRVPGR